MKKYEAPTSKSVRKVYLTLGTVIVVSGFMAHSLLGLLFIGIGGAMIGWNTAAFLMGK